MVENRVVELYRWRSSWSRRRQRARGTGSLSDGLVRTEVRVIHRCLDAYAYDALVFEEGIGLDGTGTGTGVWCMVCGVRPVWRERSDVAPVRLHVKRTKERLSVLAVLAVLASNQQRASHAPAAKPRDESAPFSSTRSYLG
ncbi:hypothetical protein VTL71DRAFT_12702 [Oculimacula yallundae]|uniref:Uncharacterized protein n=1 Tax=Oculimacula yallundae TaxID=86028 RepID=A0ABR4CNA3_9HELO